MNLSENATRKTINKILLLVDLSLWKLERTGHVLLVKRMKLHSYLRFKIHAAYDTNCCFSCSRNICLIKPVKNQLPKWTKLRAWVSSHKYRQILR